MINSTNGSWLQEIGNQLNFGVVNGSWIQGWAESMGITQSVNGSWELAIIDYLNANEDPNYGLGANTIQTICVLYGVFETLNGSWIQALAQTIYNIYTNPHISEWRTTIPNEVIDLPYTLATANGGYNGIIDWGDNTTSENTYANRTHTYATPGYYIITIYGRIRGFKFNNGPHKEKIYRVFQWGSGFNLGVGGGYFYGCLNLDLSGVTDVLQVYAPNQPISGQTINFSNAFRDCTSLTTINRVNEWDMSNVTNLLACFLNCTNFDGDVTSWNVKNVTNFPYAFSLSKFNKDISGWDVSSGQNFESMFRDNIFFNQPLNDWNMSNATNIQQMFYGATAFNQPLNNWDVSNVVTFINTFRGATAFNQPLNNWDVSNVVSFVNTFRGATAFNQPLNTWVMSNATNIQQMFRLATNFNQDIGMWDVSGVTNFVNFMLQKTFLNYSTANYDNLLIGWASRPVQPNISINFGTIKRTAASTASKVILTSAPNNWTIVDGGI